MKFSASLVDEGIRVLERSFLPACSKTGKKILLLISEDHIYLVQDTHESKGMHVVAMIETPIIFDRDTFICKSKSDDFICIRISIDVLQKALRSASSHEADSIQVALRHRPLRSAIDGIPLPLLELKWSNDSITLSQEIPIEKPVTGSELDRVKRLCALTTTCSLFIDIFPESKALLKILDQMKNLNQTLEMWITEDGDLHVVSKTSLSSIGVAFPEFDIFRQVQHTGRMAVQSVPSQGIRTSVQRRLQEAKENGRAVQSAVSAAHLQQVLRSCLLTNPARLLCGIADDHSHVSIVASYSDVLNNNVMSTNRSFDYKIPTIE